VKQKIRISSNKWKLSIFTTILPYTSKQNISIFKYIFLNDDISFSEYLNSLNLDENTYILSLRSKLTKPHIFLKQTLKNIKTNAFSIHATYL
jgi:hypothetical protein